MNLCLTGGRIERLSIDSISTIHDDVDSLRTDHSLNVLRSFFVRKEKAGGGFGGIVVQQQTENRVLSLAEESNNLNIKQKQYDGNGSAFLFEGR